MELAIIKDIVIIFTLSSLVVYLFKKLNLPSIIGFLITGILAGPHGLSLIDAVHEIEVLAEIGVILLLFTIGIEFSIKNLVRIRRTVLFGGSSQVILTIIVIYFISQGFDLTKSQAVFMGFLVALSSTAVVLKVLQDRGQLSTDYGKTALGILIFQDIAIVPMIILLPIIAGEGGFTFSMLLILVAKAGLVLVVSYILARYVIPKVFYYIARTQSNELFLMTILSVGFVVAWLTSAIGLSLALGAFIAGLTISESEYSHQAFGNVLPFREMFTSFFFISIGMLLDLHYFIQQPLLILGIVIMVILVKVIISGFVAFVLGLPFASTVVLGLVISQVGEFSFVLTKIGEQYNLIDPDTYQLFLSVAVISMSLAPFIIMLAPNISKFVMRLPLPEKMITGLRPIQSVDLAEIKNHLVIIGMGLNGTNVAKAARFAGIPYVIVDNDPDIVREQRDNNEPILFGDAENDKILNQLDIHTAEIIVITLRDAGVTLRTTEKIRMYNPMAHIIVRTRYIEDVTRLYDVGANEVIPEEFETSVQIFTRLLNRLLIPRDDIEQLTAELRADGYSLFRSDLPVISSGMKQRKLLPDYEVAMFRVKEGSAIFSENISFDKLKELYKVDLLAIRRQEQTIKITDNTVIKLQEGDLVIAFGHLKDLECVNKIFRSNTLPDC